MLACLLEGGTRWCVLVIKKPRLRAELAKHTNNNNSRVCGSVGRAHSPVGLLYRVVRSPLLLAMARALLTVVLVLAAAKDKDKPKKDKPPKLEDFEDDENSYGDEGGPTTLIVGATPEQLGGVSGMYIDDTLADEDQVDFITFEGRGDGILYGNGVRRTRACACTGICMSCVRSLRACASRLRRCGGGRASKARSTRRTSWECPWSAPRSPSRACTPRTTR